MAAIVVGDLADNLMREMDEATDNTELRNTFISWISDAVDEVCSAFDWIIHKTVFTTALVSGTAILEMAENIRDIKDIRFVDTDETIDYRDESQLFGIAADIEESGKPRDWFYVDSDDDSSQQAQLVLRFHPIPDSNYPIMISARKHMLVTPMVATDEVPLRHEHILAVKDRVRAYALANDKDYEGMNTYLQLFYNRVNKMIADESAKPGARMLVMQQRDISNDTSHKYARLDPSHFAN